MALPQNIAHRANGFGQPENSLAAFNAAATAPIDGIETDIWLTTDQQAVVQHDPLVRVGGQDRHIARTSSTQLPASVPALADVLVAAGQLPLVNLELKPSRARLGPFLALAKGDNICISSFDWTVLKKVRSALPRARIALLLARQTPLGSALRRAADLGAEALHLSLRQLDEQSVSRCRQQGLAVRVYTANTVRAWKRCTNLVVDAIMTDRPLALNSWLREQ